MDRIAILILAHKMPNQLQRLVNRLKNDYFDIFIHIGKQFDIKPFQEVVSGENVHWVDDRKETGIYSFSLIEATMSLLGDALKTRPYKYYVLLTGQDYPIKSNDEIYKCLLDSYPMDYIDMYGCDEGYSKGIDWVGSLGKTYFAQGLRNKLSKLVGNQFYFSPKGRSIRAIAVVCDYIMTVLGFVPRDAIKKTKYTYSAGSHFWMLTDSSAKFLYNCYITDDNINRIFKYAPAPEESYCQTILSAKPDIRLPDIYSQLKSHDLHMDGPHLRLIKWTSVNMEG